MSDNDDALCRKDKQPDELHGHHAGRHHGAVHFHRIGSGLARVEHRGLGQKHPMALGTEPGCHGRIRRYGVPSVRRHVTLASWTLLEERAKAVRLALDSMAQRTHYVGR